MKHAASAARLSLNKHTQTVLIKDCKAVVQVSLYQAFLHYFMYNPDQDALIKAHRKMSKQPAKNHTDLACGQNTYPQLWKGKQK